MASDPTTPIVVNTPVEQYQTPIGCVAVKREDLACTPPGPPFAKIRGLYYTIQDLISKKVPAVGYMDTTISMASWGVTFLCRHFADQIQPIIFYPTYKDETLRHNIPDHLEIWKEFGGLVLPQQATRLSIMWYKAKARLEAMHPGAHMLEQGLPSEYTVCAVADELTNIPDIRKYKHIVMCIGSGVMAAGVMRGLDKLGLSTIVHGVLVSEKSERKMYDKIFKHADIMPSGLFGSPVRLRIISAGYTYEQRVEIETPFPCNDYYDKKAYEWLMQNGDKLDGPILYWNIGANGSDINE